MNIGRYPSVEKNFNQLSQPLRDVRPFTCCEWISLSFVLVIHSCMEILYPETWISNYQIMFYCIYEWFTKLYCDYFQLDY